MTSIHRLIRRYTDFCGSKVGIGPLLEVVNNNKEHLCKVVNTPNVSGYSLEPIIMNRSFMDIPYSVVHVTRAQLKVVYDDGAGWVTLNKSVALKNFILDRCQHGYLYYPNNFLMLYCNSKHIFIEVLAHEWSEMCRTIKIRYRVL